MVTIAITLATTPPGKLADAELQFHHYGEPEPSADSVLHGMKLIGFAVWERRGGERTVTFPARQYSINGERRSFALLRSATGDLSSHERIKAIILAAYEAHVTNTATDAVAAIDAEAAPPLKTARKARS